MNKNIQDIALRALKTFIQAAGAILLVHTGLWIPALIVGALTALTSAAMNYLNIAPTSLWGRALSTFVQTFIATFAAAGYVVNEAVIVAAVAAGLSATMNLIKETF